MQYYIRPPVTSASTSFIDTDKNIFEEERKIYYKMARSSWETNFQENNRTIRNF